MYQAYKTPKTIAVDTKHTNIPVFSHLIQIDFFEEISNREC